MTIDQVEVEYILLPSFHIHELHSESREIKHKYRVSDYKNVKLPFIPRNLISFTQKSLIENMNISIYHLVHYEK